MPTISIITAVLDGTHEHIQETYESLRAQELPPGWAWQWIVQEDGETGRPLACLPDDARISSGMGPRSRAATARTLALNRAESRLVRALDADDILTEGALARDIATLTEHTEFAWCVSPTLDLTSDGQQSSTQPRARPGPLAPDHFLQLAEQVDILRLPGTTLCTYTDLVRALGGWPALPSNDDVALLLAVEAVSHGCMLREPSLLYRRWQGSTTDVLDQAAPVRRDALLDRAGIACNGVVLAGSWYPSTSESEVGALTPSLCFISSVFAGKAIQSAAP